MVIDAFTEICDAYSALKLRYSYSSLVKPWNRWIHWDGCPSPNPLREIKRTPFFGVPRRNQSNHRSHLFSNLFEMVDVLGIKTWTVSIPGVKCGVPRRHLPPPFESRVKNPQYRALGPAKSLRFPRCLGHPTEGGNWSLATVLGSPEIGKHPIVLWGKKGLENEGIQSHKLQKTGWIVIGMISGWEPTFLASMCCFHSCRGK